MRTTSARCSVPRPPLRRPSSSGWSDQPGRGLELVAECHELVMEEALAGVPPRPGALELLAALREAGRPVGLASNSSREFVERVLSVAGLLNGHFDLIVTADEVEHPKPAPDLYLAACAGLGAAPERAAALEDSQTGVTSARSRGPVRGGGSLLPGDDHRGSLPADRFAGRPAGRRGAARALAAPSPARARSARSRAVPPGAGRAARAPGRAREPRGSPRARRRRSPGRAGWPRRAARSRRPD